MGVAQWNRGSMVVSQKIRQDFDIERKFLINQMERAEELISQYDTFSRHAQDLVSDIKDPTKAKGLLKGFMRVLWLRKCDTKRFKALIIECTAAHCAWVDSDYRLSMTHVQVCRRKAQAWKDVLDALYCGVRLPFNVPATLR